jgi:hypothetical protein
MAGATRDAIVDLKQRINRAVWSLLLLPSRKSMQCERRARPGPDRRPVCVAGRRNTDAVPHLRAVKFAAVSRILQTIAVSRGHVFPDLLCASNQGRSWRGGERSGRPRPPNQAGPFPSIYKQYSIQNILAQVCIIVCLSRDISPL